MKRSKGRQLQRRVARAGPVTVGVEELLDMYGVERFNAYGRNRMQQRLEADGLNCVPRLTAGELTSHGVVRVYAADQPRPAAPDQPGVPSRESGRAAERGLSSPGPSGEPWTIRRDPAISARNEESTKKAARALADRVARGDVEQLTVGALLARFNETRLAPFLLSSLEDALGEVGIATTPSLAADGVGMETRLKLSTAPPRLRRPRSTALAVGGPKKPGGMLTRFGEITVHADRLVTHEGRSYPIGPETTASVEAAGSVAATRGRNLAAKAVGGLLIPGGVFFFGNARERYHDFRELYLVVEDPKWHYTVQCHPDAGTQVREVASAVKQAARGMAAYEQQVTQLEAREQPRELAVSSETPDTSIAHQGDPVERLRKLADLHERGALTDDEFAAAKAKLLEQM